VDKKYLAFFLVILMSGLNAAHAAELRVMTFNLRYASAADGSNKWENADQSPQRREVALAVITNHQPDIIGFQEGEDVQIDYLSSALPAYGFQRQKPSGGSGSENAAFAYNTNVLALLDRGVISLGPSPGGGYWNNTPGTNFEPYVFFPDMGLGFPRIALWGRFEVLATGQEFIFCTTHFDFNNTPQVGSAVLITDNIQARNNLMPFSPMAIVVGDFNSSQNNNDWKLFTGSFTSNGITGDFTDSWQQVVGNWTGSGTIHGFNGGIISENDRIDWILHRGLTATQVVIVTDARISTNIPTGGSHLLYASDHYPVMADLLLPDSSPDYDRDGLPDAMELMSSNSLPADPDTDDDGLLDGQEDLDGDGVVEGGETDPGAASATQNPTDIRQYQMDGIADYASDVLSSDGMGLRWRFDGRYLYVATADAGEGSDHFVFIARNPDVAVSAPWAKTGMVARWDAYLADENDAGRFSGWFSTNGLMTNLFEARSATFYDDSTGALEGVIDLSVLYGSGFTNTFYVAAGPYATTNGGHLWSSGQAPAGNGDGNILGAGEYAQINPGDLDADGLNDYADPDRDGDGLPDEWESVYGFSPDSPSGDNGPESDPDGDAAPTGKELLACTFPNDENSVFKISGIESSGGTNILIWSGVYKKEYKVWRSVADSFSNGMSWSCLHTNPPGANFPTGTNAYPSVLPSAAGTFYRLELVQ